MAKTGRLAQGPGGWRGIVICNPLARAPRLIEHWRFEKPQSLRVQKRNL
jgi:hypothetical protein